MWALTSWRKEVDLLLEIMLVGTTVKGAVDDLDLVIQILKEVGYTEDRFYIHIDGALFGLMIPFVKRVSIHPFFFSFWHVHDDNEFTWWTDMTFKDS